MRNRCVLRRAKQTREVLLLPRDGSCVRAKFAFSLQKLTVVKAASSVLDSLGKDVVKQLVVDDCLDEVARYPRLIENRVDRDDAVLAGTKTNRLTGRMTLDASAPRDHRIRSPAVEILRPDLVKKLCQVVMTTEGSLGNALGCSTSEACDVSVAEVIYFWRDRHVRADELHQFVEDVFRCVEE